MYNNWEELEEVVKQCRKCRLCENRKNVVFGVGNREADIMFIGEGPGADEDAQGEPFVGKAGKLMNMAFDMLGIKREEVYIANIVKCRPPNNRNPQDDEAENCLDYLRNQVILVKPKIIVLLGSVALKNILGKEYGITASRGKWIEKKTNKKREKTNKKKMKLINKALAATIMLAGAAPSLWAQKSEPQVKVVNDIKFSGYVMTQYQYSAQKDAESNSFNLRMVRMALEGRFFNDFYWKAQVQLNGNTSTLGSSPRLVDAFAEWQKYKEARIKIGQFKRPFSFENPMHPIDQGFMSYAQNITKLAGFSDRVGEQASNGRDIGVQLQGDLLPNANGHRVLHYQVGVFNGQGINMKDVDNRKDVIGGIWLMPVSGMRIGAFGWTGSYARTGTWTENGETVSGTRTVSRNRYAISGEYVKDDWTFRSEYIHSQGYGFSTTYQKDGQQKDCTINTGAGDKADGLYALLIAPVKKNKVHLKARYDMYRPKAEWSTAKTQYEIGADYCLGKNIKLNAEYVFVNDRKLAKSNYNMLDFQVDVRF